MKSKRGHNYVIDRVENIKKEYGKKQVLFNDLSLEIDQGEFVGLIGKKRRR